MSAKQQVDYMDQFSKPTRVTNLGPIIIFHMPRRADPKKPGRVLDVLSDFRPEFALIPGFLTAYSYNNTIYDVEYVAGNHYHVKKQELMSATVGAFEIKAEDIKTKAQATWRLENTEGEHQIVFVRPEVAHSVRALVSGSVIHVDATSPNNDGDEYPYPITW